MAIAAPVFYEDLLDDSSDEGAFEAGVFVGHLHMAGGYIVVESERGMQVRSKEIAFHERERYRRLASKWLASALRSALAWRRIDAVEIGALPREAIARPKKREVRGSGRFDRRDDQNLPRFDLVPLRLSKAQRSALPDVGGASYLLVPFIVDYYSHNGGWFVGQTYGTGGGARIRVFWALYDTLDGSVVRWGDISGRRIDAHVFSPNSTQIDDYLLAVEEAVARKLRRRLLR